VLESPHLGGFIYSGASGLSTPFLEPGGEVTCTHRGVMHLLDGLHLSSWWDELFLEGSFKLVPCSIGNGIGS